MGLGFGAGLYVGLGPTLKSENLPWCSGMQTQSYKASLQGSQKVIWIEHETRTLNLKP